MAARATPARAKGSRASRKKPPKAAPAVRPLSLRTLRVLQMVLNMQKLDVKADDFEEVATSVIGAKGELQEQIEAAEAAERTDGAAEPEADAE
jgi:hypothetical protein